MNARRFGHRRLHGLHKREGYVINHKKLFRLYREEKLAVRRVAAAPGCFCPDFCTCGDAPR
jgi:hypothetical protein